MYIDVIEKKSNFLDFLFEVVEQPNLFKSIKNKFNYSNILESQYLFLINHVSYYPLKSSLEDFYRSTNLSKNSNTMAKCSQEQRKTINNFKFND
jgi:hypothetical protein